MFKLKLTLAATALALAMATPASSESAVSPWETFCLIVSDPGEDLGSCLDGVPLPSANTGGLAAPGGQAEEPESGRESSTLKLRQLTPGAGKR